MGLWRWLFGKRDKQELTYQKPAGDGMARASRPMDRCRVGSSPHAGPPTPDQDFAIAQRAFFTDNDPAHALFHLAGALMGDHRRAEFCELLDRLIDTVGAPVRDLVPEKEEMWTGEALVRAYVMERLGDLEEALQMLRILEIAMPDTRVVADWGIQWLERAENLDSVTESTFGGVMAGLMRSYPEYAHATVPVLAEIRRMSALADRFVAGRAVQPLFELMRIALIRKSGRFEDALRAAEALYQREPGYFSAIAVAYALRECGRGDESLAMLNKAAAHDPSQFAVLNDIGDMCLGNGRMQEALDAYERVLSIEPQDPWAQPSVLYCKYQLAGDVASQDPHITQLVALAKDGNSRAQQLLGMFRTYTGMLPEPADATANVFRQMKPDDMRNFGDSVKLTLSHLDSPSNLTAFALQMAALGVATRLDMKVESVPDPDPRLPMDPVTYLLWKYDGTDPSPALPPPSAEVARRVAKLAGQHYDYDRNWSAARQMAKEMSPANIGDLLATMVHPPPLPADASVLVWLPRVQLAAAYLIAHIEDGWVDSQRRQALFDVVRGPADWTTIAGIIALSRLANEIPEAHDGVHELFLRRFKQSPKEGHCTYMHALLYNWLLMDGLKEEVREALERLLADYNKE